MLANVINVDKFELVLTNVNKCNKLLKKCRKGGIVQVLYAIPAKACFLEYM